MKILRQISTDSWQRIYKNRHILAKDLELSDAEYRLWDLYSAASGWDKRHKDRYRVTEATDEEVGFVLNWSASKACRTRNNLIKKGLIRTVKDGLYEALLIPSPDFKDANVQEKASTTQDKPAPVEAKVASVQTIPGENDTESLVSYKGIYSSISSLSVYRDVKKRVEDISRTIDRYDGWLSDDPKLKAIVDEQQRLAGLMLEYELENDMIPDLL